MRNNIIANIIPDTTGTGYWIRITDTDYPTQNLDLGLGSYNDIPIKLEEVQAIYDACAVFLHNVNRAKDNYKTMLDIYENEMMQEYRFHSVPHTRVEDGYRIDWSPKLINAGEKDQQSEYILTIYKDNHLLCGSFEKWKKIKGLL